MPTGLSSTTIDSSSWMIRIPSTSSGSTASGSATAGMVTSSRAPACTRSLLPASCPSTSTWPSAMRAAARVRERPNMRAMRGVDPLPGQALGDGDDALLRRAGHDRSPRLAAGAGDADAPPGLDDDQHDGHVDEHVGDVEDRPVRQRQEVDDVTAQHARRAEDPVGQVAADAGQQQAESDRPGAVAEPTAEPDHHAGGDQGDHRQHQRVRRTGAERGARVAHQVEAQHPVDHVHRVAVGQVARRRAPWSPRRRRTP